MSAMSALMAENDAQQSRDRSNAPESVTVPVQQRSTPLRFVLRCARDTGLVPAVVDRDSSFKTWMPGKSLRSGRPKAGPGWPSMTSQQSLVLCQRPAPSGQPHQRLAHAQCGAVTQLVAQ
jgi:hypothetical protein